VQHQKTEAFILMLQGLASCGVAVSAKIRGSFHSAFIRVEQLIFRR